MGCNVVDRPKPNPNQQQTVPADLTQYNSPNRKISPTAQANHLDTHVNQVQNVQTQQKPSKVSAVGQVQQGAKSQIKKDQLPLVQEFNSKMVKKPEPSVHPVASTLPNQSVINQDLSAQSPANVQDPTSINPVKSPKSGVEVGQKRPSEVISKEGSRAKPASNLNDYASSQVQSESGPRMVQLGNVKSLESNISNLKASKAAHIERIY